MDLTVQKSTDSECKITVFHIKKLEEFRFRNSNPPSPTSPASARRRDFSFVFNGFHDWGDLEIPPFLRFGPYLALTGIGNRVMIDTKQDEFMRLFPPKVSIPSEVPV